MPRKIVYHVAATLDFRNPLTGKQYYRTVCGKRILNSIADKDKATCAHCLNFKPKQAK